MESNNTVLAPQISNVDEAYAIWRKSYLGSRNDFYRFMTVPSDQRDKFLQELGLDFTFKGSIVSIKAKSNED